MSGTHWNDYLRPRENFRECRRQCWTCFAGQRERIRQLVRTRHPHTIVCMGSGSLNDLPIEDFIDEGASVYLVDWVRDVSRLAYLHDIVQPGQEDFQCVICRSRGSPQTYCPNHRPFPKVPDAPRQVCANFRLDSSGLPLCQNFEFGTDPRFLQHDVTQGRGGEFARRVDRIVERARNPKAVFQNALREVHRLETVRECLPIPDHSVDFVTSAMLVSQFEFEPYGFLARRLVERFGEESLVRQEEKLRHPMEKLRDRLFQIQVDGHFREIHRILKPEGRVYLSLESFHRGSGKGPWFRVKELFPTLAGLERSFGFDFDAVPSLANPDRTKILEGESIIQSFVLVPRPEGEASVP